MDTASNRTTRPNTWLSFPAESRQAAEVFENPEAKDDFRIDGYDMDVSVTNSAELSALTRVKFQHLASGSRVLVFHLDANLRVEKVTDAGRELSFFQPRDPKDRNQSYGDYIAVALAQPSQVNQEQTLEFRYGGKRVIRRVGQGQFFCQSFGWYPSQRNIFASRADFAINFSFPKRYKLVATGNKIKEGADGNVATSSWKSDIPLAVAGFAYGDYKVETTTAGAIDVEVYANWDADDSMAAILRITEGGMGSIQPGARPVYPALGSLSPAAMARTIAVEVANSLSVFERFFGPYPYKRLAVANIPYSYGQGWPTLLYLSAISFLDSTQRNALGIREHTEITDFFRAHETSHQWWGHGVGWKSYHDQWLSEGFAQFSGNLYVLVRRNQKEYLNRLRRDKDELKERDLRNRTFESLGPIWMGTRLSSSDSPTAYSKVIYNKGGYVLHMLRMMLFDPRNQRDPDARFRTMMEDFCRTFRNRPASTEDFKALAEKHMLPVMDLDGNKRLDWFFHQYVYGTGIPDYRFSYQIQDAGQGNWKISGSVRQSGVPADWKGILPLYIHSSGRTVRLGWITVRGAETPFDAILPTKPDKLSINENEEILAEIHQ